MKLNEKIRYLREIEGQLRGLGRALSQQEMMRAIAKEGKQKISQSYLSQIESGARPHLSNKTRGILAGFFKVHPGYLVDDPEGYHAELLSELRTLEMNFDVWLYQGVDRFENDSELSEALLTIAKEDDSRQCVLLLEAIVQSPGLKEKLLQLLRPHTSVRKKQAGNSD